jgi:OmpA-OmpF porin, OOP family
VVGVGSTDLMFNGCPQRTDRDGDSIFDDQDACVDDAGVASAEPSKNGCPTDIDQDGILDRDDACVNEPGVANSDRAKNGCPPDTDGDGVYDAVDACATQAGVANADPKLNGCPPDKDGDGILDATDACPELKGPADPDPTRNGCPRVQVTKERVVILDRIEFDTNKATIRDTSATILGQVFEALRDNPQITLVRIEGHTDSTGKRKSNAELSRLRAMAVVNRLKEMGIEAKRMIAEGLGQEKPIDSNDTEEGRQNNRRVEFHIVKAEPVEPSVK